MPAPSRRDCLAIVGGFGKLAPDRAHGANRAGITVSNALANTRRFPLIHAYHNYVSRPLALASLALPRVPDISIEPMELAALSASATPYHAIYVAEGGSHWHMPSTLRASDDFAPFILQYGTTHNDQQWSTLLVGALTGSLRATDVIIAKAARSATVLRDAWGRWRERFNVSVPRIESISNGIAVEENARNEDLRHALRRSLALEPDAPLFLCFSRIQAHTKGDQRGLVALWREVIARNPRATLLLAGAASDRGFVEELQTTARAFGVAHRVHLLPNPYEIWPRARTALMSAADAFLHLSTGAEEALSLVVLEAMAHELPVVVSDWSGNGSIVDDGVEGFVIPTVSAALPRDVDLAQWGYDGNIHIGLVAESVAIDAPSLVNAVLQLSDKERARSMGARAKGRVQARHRVEDVAARHVALMDEASDRAAREWQGDVGQRALVSSDAVLSALATGRLSPEETVHLVNDAIARRAPEFRTSASPDIAGIVVSLLREGGARTGRELCASIASQLGAGPEAVDAVWPYCARAILRLANHHAIEIAPANAEEGRR